MVLDVYCWITNFSGFKQRNFTISQFLGWESRCTFAGQFWLRVSEATIWLLVSLQFSQAWKEGEDLPGELPWIWEGFSPSQMLSWRLLSFTGHQLELWVLCKVASFGAAHSRVAGVLQCEQTKSKREWEKVRKSEKRWERVKVETFVTS